MRLIDADKLIELSTRLDLYGMVEIGDIEEQPTVYDVDEVVKALEKQVPKKYKIEGITDRDGVFHAWNGIDGRPYELCPNCGVNLCTDGMRINKKPKYCHNCGQAIDWSEEE